MESNSCKFELTVYLFYTCRYCVNFRGGKNPSFKYQYNLLASFLLSERKITIIITFFKRLLKSSFPHSLARETDHKLYAEDLKTLAQIDMKQIFFQKLSFRA